MAAEKSHAEQPDPLTQLGLVGRAAPEILSRAREKLWSAVTAEMLASPPAAARGKQAAGDKQAAIGRRETQHET